MNILLHYIAGVAVIILAVLVLVGWYDQIVPLVKVGSASPPMAFNTAVAFLISGCGLLAIGSRLSRLALPAGIVVAALGLATLAEYGWPGSFGLNLAPHSDILPLVSDMPVRMAPNTALCFLLVGFALVLAGLPWNFRLRWAGGAVAGSLVLAFAAVPLLGYASRLPMAYEWGRYIGMAINTAGGMVVLGGGLVAMAWWRDAASGHERLPRWLPLTGTLGMLAVTIALWQALYSAGLQHLPGPRQVALGVIAKIVLFFGCVVALGFGAIVLALQRANRHAAALRNAVQLNKTVVESTHYGIVVYDRDLLYRVWNPFMERMTGLSAQEVLGHHPRDVFPFISQPEFIGRLENALAGNSNTTAEVRFVEPETGRVVWAANTSTPLRNADGQVVGVIASIDDITERKLAEEKLKESEARFRQMFEHNGSVTLVVDPEKREIVSANNAAATFYGYSPEDLIGKPLAEINMNEPEDTEQDLNRALGEDLNYFNFRHRLANGELRDVEVYSTPVVIDGKTRLLSTIHDITERKRAEKARIAMETQLRQSQKMEALGTLAGGIAHDFNNLLATILGNVVLGRQDMADNPEALLSLEEINKAAERARNLVQQILTFSRKRANQQVNQKLRPVLEEALKLLRSTLPSGIDLVAEFTDAPLTVCADANQIEQFLMNLCTNAWHALDDNVGRIEIGLAQVRLDAETMQGLDDLAPGDYALISIRDNGCGMDDATLAHIFDPFFTTKDVGKGTGLGLSVVHGIVQAHHGAIKVESAPGAGTMVRVYLPLAAASADIARREPAPRAAPGAGQRVLYVDDEFAMVQLVQRMLDRLGYRTSGFAVARDAVEAVRADPCGFDLVVTDYNMPGMSGLDVAREIRRISPKLPVVISAGYITDELRENASLAGVRNIVFKPNTVDELCQAIQHILSAENE
jgi:PAS domain S-box-containing protein